MPPPLAIYRSQVTEPSPANPKPWVNGKHISQVDECVLTFIFDWLYLTFWELTSNRISTRQLRPAAKGKAQKAWLFPVQPQALGLPGPSPATAMSLGEAPGVGR